MPASLATPPEPGRRGKKDGQGLYKWVDGKPVKPELPKDYQAPDDLQDRLLLPLLNEAVACLHDGVVADADLLDAGVIFGTGFAPASSRSASATTPSCRQDTASLSSDSTSRSSRSAGAW